MSQLKSKIDNTFKSRETEELLDKIFYRPLGYLIALGSKKIGMTPNAVTILSIFIGVIAGHLFYYNNLMINMIGILMLISAEALDSADGQLARMTDRKSMYGRILDGFGGNLWFISIYIHLCFRLIESGSSYTIFLLAIIAGISHSLQSAMADYYRNYYLYMVFGENKSEVVKSNELQLLYEELSWRKHFIKKFLMRVYINYTIEQEYFSKKSINLITFVSRQFPDQLPAEIQKMFSEKNKKLIKYYNILTTNTRMMVLFLSILTGYLQLYFIFEISILNILLIWVVYKHEQNSQEILDKAKRLNVENVYA
ncbi:MAG: CDP-alcohol phosphatidyltransferase family protein [Ignavibacterium sp.]|jgi:phosphatidylglycerophosphate synthase|nr:CDP-alcohol phosphatidyltransferase family protein [Ignavibacterium sp.]